MRILIADDSSIIRRAIREILLEHSEDWCVCGEAIDGPSVIDQVGQLPPDVVLLDLSMPRLDGVQAAAVLQKGHPHLPIIIMSEQDPALLQRLGQECRFRYTLPKSRLGQDLLPILNKIARTIETREFDDR